MVTHRQKVTYYKLTNEGIRPVFFFKLFKNNTRYLFVQYCPGIVYIIIKKKTCEMMDS